jgi:hypothetical protein
MTRPNPAWTADEKANYRRLVRQGKSLLRKGRGADAVEGIAWTAIQNLHNADKADDCRSIVIAREKELLADIAYPISFYAGLLGCSLDEVVRLGEKRRAAIVEDKQ